MKIAVSFSLNSGIILLFFLYACYKFLSVTVSLSRSSVVSFSCMSFQIMKKCHSTHQQWLQQPDSHTRTHRQARTHRKGSQKEKRRELRRKRQKLREEKNAEKKMEEKKNENKRNEERKKRQRLFFSFLLIMITYDDDMREKYITLIFSFPQSVSYIVYLVC